MLGEALRVECRSPEGCEMWRRDEFRYRLSRYLMVSDGMGMQIKEKAPADHHLFIICPRDVERAGYVTSCPQTRRRLWRLTHAEQRHWQTLSLASLAQNETNHDATRYTTSRSLCASLVVLQRVSFNSQSASVILHAFGTLPGYFRGSGSSARCFARVCKSCGGARFTSLPQS